MLQRLIYLGTSEQIKKLKQQEIKEIVQELIDYEFRQEIINYPSYAEYAPYGDTYVECGREYKDRDIEECKEIAREKILKEFKEDPMGFMEDNNLTDFTETEVLTTINEYV